MRIVSATKGMGETMNIQTTPAAKYSSASKIQDVLMVSAFAAWALLLGLSPVLAFHALS
jgi:hypothetical protein